MRTSAKNVSTRLKLPAKFSVIEDLAAARQDDLTVFIRDRLTDPNTIDRVERYMGQTNLPAAIESVPIRPSVPDHRRHATERIERHATGIVQNDSRYPRHLMHSLSVGQLLLERLGDICGF